MQTETTAVAEMPADGGHTDGLAWPEGHELQGEQEVAGGSSARISKIWVDQIHPIDTSRHEHAVVQFSVHPLHSEYHKVCDQVVAIGVAFEPDRKDWHHQGWEGESARPIAIHQVCPVGLPGMLVEAGFCHFRSISYYYKSNGAIVIECVLERTEEIGGDVSDAIVDFLDGFLLLGNYYLAAVWDNPATAMRPTSVSFNFGTGHTPVIQPKYRFTAEGTVFTVVKVNGSAAHA